MPPENRTDNSRPEKYWKFIQFGFVRIIIAMGSGFIFTIQPFSRAIVVLSGESKPSLELWVGNYHVHHFFIGMLLLAISGLIGLVGNQKKYK